MTDAAGRPKFAQLDREIFAGYRAFGFKLEFRIMVNNQSTDARYVTPRTVIEHYRIPTVMLPSRRAGEQVCAVFWSPEFLAAHEELMREFGAWFDGHPWAAQAELGTIGEWGEMHLGRWGAASLAAHGWGPTTFFRTVTAFMNQMERHLPRTTKAFCWAPIFNIDPDPAYDGQGAWQEGTITHRPRPNDRTLRVLFLGKGAESADVELSQWCVEEIDFPSEL